MQLIEVENQINMQYLAQLLQNEDFEIKKYKYRNNLWNADNLQSQELLSLFRQFQFYDSAKKKQDSDKKQAQVQREGSNEIKVSNFAHPAFPQENQRNQNNNENLQENQSQQQRNEQQIVDVPNQEEIQIDVGEEGMEIVRNNSDNNLLNNENNLRGQAEVADRNPEQLVVKRQQEDPYTVKVIISCSDEINFPATMQKYPFKQKVYDLTMYEGIVTKGILRRLIFLSISGYIGFDNTERIELIKGAFLLEFDAFFQFLMKPNICSILQFDKAQDEVLDVLIFMWQTNIRKSMKYYDFIVKITTINSNLFKKGIGISPKILNLDLTLMETQFLPLIHRVMQTDPNLTPSQAQLSLKQIVEYYEIHNSKRIVYPFIQQQSEKDVSDQVEEKYQNLLKEFECPICFLPFDNCYTSKCGHSFCQNCITDAVQKFGNCPVCQQNIAQNDIFRNFHMNQIKDIAYKEKEQSKEYEINRMNHMNTFKEKFQEIMQANIINSLQAKQEQIQPNSNNDSLQSYESIQKLKKQIQYLVNTTFDQLMNTFKIES